MKRNQKGTQARTSAAKKGFYAVLALCMAAVGVAVYTGITGTLHSLQESPAPESSASLQDSGADDWNYPETNGEGAAAVHQDTNPPKEETSSEEEEVLEETQGEASDSQEEPPAPSEDAAPRDVAFAMPLEGEILQEYSNGELVKSKTLQEWHTHDGVDIGAEADTPVKCVADGEVTQIKEDPLWGICVTVSHADQYESFYHGLKLSLEVEEGQTLQVGDLIGYVGNTAEIEIAEESHLHFAMKQKGEWIDPLSVMSQGA